MSWVQYCWQTDGQTGSSDNSFLGGNNLLFSSEGDLERSVFYHIVTPSTTVVDNITGTPYKL